MGEGGGAARRLDYDARLRLRRAFGVVVPVVLLAVTATALFTDRLPGAGETGPREPAPPAQAAPVTRSTVPPPGEPGVVLTVTPGADGSISVTEEVRLDRPTAVLRLTPPAVSGAGTAFADRRAVVTDLRLDVDGRPSSTAPERLLVPVDVALPVASRWVSLKYVVRGTTVVSTPSSARRASIALAPLTQASARRDQVVLAATGSTVRSVTCPLAPVDQRLCVNATTGDGVVSGGAERDLALFVLQVDLPKA